MENCSLNSVGRQRVLLDLFCGRGGWSIPARAAGWRCVGIDHLDHGGYPGQTIIQSLPCSDAQILAFCPDLIVASPPCESFARFCLPWINDPSGVVAAKRLLDWACGLPGRLGIPVVVECSRFAARFGSIRPTVETGCYALWGDVPVLLPVITKRKTKMSGLDPAARSLLDQGLAEWVIACHGGMQ